MNNITAKIITDSISANGNRMTTFEIEYPRFILAELNTHRMLSKNSASSRAIPVAAMHKQIQDSPATPVYWGRNMPGMQAKEQVTGLRLALVKKVWGLSRNTNILFAKILGKLGLHKQLSNRRTEPDMMMKTVISGTEWANLFWLRDHPDAQPEFADLARKMHIAYNGSIPQLLHPGEWHVPYVHAARRKDSDKLVYFADNEAITVEEAKIISASCCAQVSYRKNDATLEKATKIFKQLIESQPCHASPVEHQATPMQSVEAEIAAEELNPGISHIDRKGNLWSGNLQGWIQFRKLLPNEAVW